MFFNPLTAKLFNFNFHPLEVVSRWRDPQPQASENYSDFKKMDMDYFQILLIKATYYIQYVWKLIWNMLKKNVKKI